MMPTKTGQSAKRKTPHSIFDEIADFLATSPARDAVLDYHPSTALQRRASQLLQKNREETLSAEDRRNLDEFSHAESLIRRLKAKLRRVKRP